MNKVEIPYNAYSDLNILFTALHNKIITKKVRDKIQKNPHKFLNRMIRMFEEKEMYEFCKYFMDIKDQVDNGTDVIKLLKFKVV